jgi:hypothetical protein
MLAVTDFAAVEAWCIAYARWCTERVDTKQVMWLNQMRQWGMKLGLTPADRLKMEVNPPDAVEDSVLD